MCSCLSQFLIDLRFSLNIHCSPKILKLFSLCPSQSFKLRSPGSQLTPKIAILCFEYVILCEVGFNLRQSTVVLFLKVGIYAVDSLLERIDFVVLALDKVLETSIFIADAISL